MSSVTIKHWVFFMLVISFAMASPANLHAVELVENPLKDYLKKLPTVFKDDSVIQLTIDINEDGVKDYFYTSSSRDTDMSRQGRVWTSYLSAPQGYETPSHDDIGANGHEYLVVSASNALVQYHDELGGRKAITTFYPGGGGSGSIVAFYVDSENRLRKKVLSRVERGEVLKPVKKEELANPILDDEIQIETILLRDILTEDEYEKLTNKADFFWEKYRINEDRSNRDIDYVFSKESIDEYTYNYEVVGIKENGVANLIPLDVMPQEIVEIVIDRAEARLRNARLNSPERLAELEKLVEWSNAWHEEFGYQKRMQRKTGVSPRQFKTDYELSDLIDTVEGTVVLNEEQASRQKIFDPDLGLKNDEVQSTKHMGLLIAIIVAVILISILAVVIFIMHRRKGETVNRACK